MHFVLVQFGLLTFACWGGCDRWDANVLTFARCDCILRRFGLYIYIYIKRFGK